MRDLTILSLLQDFPVVKEGEGVQRANDGVVHHGPEQRVLEEHYSKILADFVHHVLVGDRQHLSRVTLQASRV